MTRHTWRPTASLVLALAALMSVVAAAAELQERSARAYAVYRQDAEARFLERARGNARVSAERETIHAQAAMEDGIISVPGGLVHNWSGYLFVPGATLRTAIEVSKRYSAYRSMYKEISASRLLDQDGDTFHVLMRIQGGEAGVTAVLDVRSTVAYALPAEGRAVIISNSDEIREVRRASSGEEQLLPAGHDSGYLWRANVFTLFVQTDGGLYMETETLGLSRSFPPLLGWIIEPIARRLGRKSVVRSLEQFQAAIRAAGASPATGAARSEPASKGTVGP